MQALPLPHIRSAGVGPGVVCLHSNASSSAQWRRLAALLAPEFQVQAPDLYGAGKSPNWPGERPLGLQDEVAFIEPALAAAGALFALVGHSYGASVALMAALRDPSRVRSLVLYEPTLFSLVDAYQPPPNEADGIRFAVADAQRALALGDEAAAAKRFIDYWSGPGAWDATPPARQQAFANSARQVGRWGHALFNEATPLHAFRALDMPVLYLMGRDTTAAARAVAQLLCGVLPNVRRIEIEGLGHMGPVTHPEAVNPLIASFL